MPYWFGPSICASVSAALAAVVVNRRTPRANIERARERMMGKEEGQETNSRSNDPT